MIEVFVGAILFVLAYPANVIFYSLELPAQMLGWLGMGVAVLVILTRLQHRSMRRVWVAVWFMPGAIICGGAALLPWPFALWAHFGPGNCATKASLFVAAVINLVAVFSSAEAWRWLRGRRGPHNKLFKSRRAKTHAA